MEPDERMPNLSRALGRECLLAATSNEETRDCAHSAEAVYRQAAFRASGFRGLQGEVTAVWSSILMKFGGSILK